jgi:hypothetical protein
MFPNTKSNDFYTGIVRCSAARTTQRQGAAAANQIARPSTGVDIANSACRYLHVHDFSNNCEITTYPIVGSFCTFSLLYFSPARRWSLIQTQRVGNYSIFTFSSYLAVQISPCSDVNFCLKLNRRTLHISLHTDIDAK